MGLLYRILSLVLLMTATVFGRITYTLSFEDRAEHYITVDLEVDGLRGKDYQDFRMAVWTPGSYLVREFSRNVVDLTARSGIRELPATKVNKNTWRVDLNRQRRIFVRYKVYAFQPDHRSSFVNEDGAMLNGASVFIFPDGMESQESLVVINKPRSWDQVTSALPWVGGRSPVFRAANYDVLVDSPIMMGNHTVLDFEVSGVSHRYAISGEGDYDPDRLVTDTGKIIREIHDIFGSVPYDDYTLFLQLWDERTGALEHSNSSHFIVSRDAFQKEQRYHRLLGIVAHEVFHAYNGKRIRPESLGPFDYDRENYTTLLWVVEGFTSYYDRLLLRRADLLTVEEYLDQLARSIKELESTPGRHQQTLQQASFDAWIKHYRPDENSPNTAISYYTKGSLVALALDLTIRAFTDGERGLDDVFRLMWQDYLVARNGYSHEDFRAACDSVAGRSLDDVFQYVTTTAEMDWQSVLEPFGLMLVRGYMNPGDSTRAYYGFRTCEEDEQLKITRIDSNTPAARAGLSVHDELISIDNYRLLGAVAEQILASRSQDKAAALVVNRNGIMRTFTIRPTPPPYDMLSIVRMEPPTEQQERLYTGWLQIPWE
ncbi:MAG: M61 family metallopeptidase [Fidelibacterota bacterium]|nr:MAG: M61 family metallopeptidase [Candidatus Neomarinimicrobiota bacterium]